MFLKKTTIIFLGSFLISIGINVFLVPNKLLEGGAVGISLIIHYLFGVKVGLMFLLISLPIFIIAWFFYRSYFYNGIHGMLLSSIIIDILYPLHALSESLAFDPIICAALGGVFIGSGVGIMFLLDISNGGIDLLAQMLSRKLNVNAGITILCFDFIIVSIGTLFISSSNLLLSYVTIIFVGMSTTLIVAKKSERSSKQVTVL